MENAGVRCRRLTDDEIWHRIRDRAIDRYTKAIAGFIGRCRKLSLTSEDLRRLITASPATSPVEAKFLELAQHFFSAYLARLEVGGEEDFDGLMQRASELVGAGTEVFERRNERGDLSQLRYICIDEFQDFSELFYRLLTAIRARNPAVELFCVGDDWQAINGFAGSDLRFFESFEKHIGSARRLHISTNYRSDQKIVEVGNTLMDRLGKPARAHKNLGGEVLVADLNDFVPTVVRSNGTPAIRSPPHCFE